VIGGPRNLFAQQAVALRLETSDSCCLRLGHYFAAVRPDMTLGQARLIPHGVENRSSALRFLKLVSFMFPLSLLMATAEGCLTTSSRTPAAQPPTDFFLVFSARRPGNKRWLAEMDVETTPAPAVNEPSPLTNRLVIFARPSPLSPTFAVSSSWMLRRIRTTRRPDLHFPPNPVRRLRPCAAPAVAG